MFLCTNNLQAMSTSDFAKEKLILVDWILHQDKLSNLKAISLLIETIDQEKSDSVMIEGYRAKGVSCTTTQLKDSIIESMKEIESMEFISLDRLEQESDLW